MRILNLRTWTYALCLGISQLASGQLTTEPQDDTISDRTLINDVADVRDSKVPNRWVGVVCVPVDEVLHAHLSLPEGSGLVVQSVVPGSPAAEAGLEEHDILLSAADQPIASVKDLSDAIAKAADKPFPLTWLHKGQAVTKPVTPALRPQEMSWNSPTPGAKNWSFEAGPGQIGQLKKWVEQLEQGRGNDQGLMLNFLGPAMHFGDGPSTFEGSLSVEIDKQSDEPARIKVRRGDESWELTEDNLEELPEDIRGHVQGMLGKHSKMHVFSLPGHGVKMAVPFVPGQRESSSPGMPMPLDIQRQFEEMNQRMEQMLNELRQLKEVDQKPKDVIDA